MSMRNKAPFLSAIFIFTILACSINNINISTAPDLALTVTAQALFIQLTSQAQSQPQSQPIVAFTETFTPIPLPTNTTAPSATPTPQKPMVINSTLCWLGPAGKYEVVSSLSKGEFVDIIGRGSISGWFIIRNPRYNDPCWVQATDLQLDASFDINALQLYNPPPLPTNTPKPTPIPSPTP